MDIPALPGNGWESATFPYGTLMAYRRACLEQIGLFDERYFTYTEEYEIALRARRAGWEVGIVWGAVVKNPMAAASSELMWYLLIRNQLLAVYQTDGRARAMVLTIQLIAGSVVRRTVLRSRRNDGDRGNVRWRAIRDFWRDRLGRPPMLAN
jgi:GT2 family glycosyltransferase